MVGENVLLFYQYIGMFICDLCNKLKLIVVCFHLTSVFLASKRVIVDQDSEATMFLLNVTNFLLTKKAFYIIQ